MSAGARQALTITLPWPDKALSPNAGNASPYPARRARRAYREAAGWRWLSAMSRGEDRYLTPPVVADITFTYTVERARDEDNHIAMLKPVWDGAKDAGVIVDDNADVFSIGTVAFVKGTVRGVTVCLTSRGVV